MTTTTTDVRAVAAAEAAVSLLPAPSPLTVGTPTTDTVSLVGQAVRARFTGSAEGEIAVIFGPELIGALAMSPLGALDVTQAVRPALEAAAATLGPVVVDPGEVTDPDSAAEAVLAAQGVLIPLLGEDGDVKAAVGLALKAQIGGTPDGAAPAASAPGSGAGPAAPAAAAAAGPDVTAYTGPDLSGTPRPSVVAQRGSLDLLHDVEMEVTAELGRTRMSVRDLLSLAPGTVIELDRLAGGPADLLVNGRLIARGEVVVIDENFGIRITEIVVG